MLRLTVALFFVLATTAQAQRPWVKQSSTSVGGEGKLLTVNGDLVFFDADAKVSYNLGVVWEPISTLTNTVCAIASVSSGVSIAATYNQIERQVHLFVSSGVTNWTEYASHYSLNAPSQIASIDSIVFLSTAGSYIYVYSDRIDSVRLEGANPRIYDLAVVNNVLIASTTAGIYFSLDKGKTFSIIVADGTGPLHVLNNTAYVATTGGVRRINIQDKTATLVGKWPNDLSAPPIVDIDSFHGRLYALSYESPQQLYELEEDTQWITRGYPLPAGLANPSISLMAIDAGWAIVSHQLPGNADSSGIYAYDLNDFTSVHNAGTISSTPLSLSAIDGGLVVASTKEGRAELTVVDVLGRVLHSSTVNLGAPISVPIQAGSSGFVGVIARYSNGTLMRGHILY